jgi:hypothetical protein
MQFSYLNVDDSIITSKYNPNYFNENKTSAFIFDIGYNYQFLQLDNINYPLKGKAYTISIYKRGIGFSGGLNMLGLDVSYNKYIPHPHKFYSSFQFSGKIKLPFQQSYINQRSLGYGSFYLRGLEYYVIDGVAASLAKYTFRKKLISFKIPVPFHIKALPYLPFGFYAKTYADAGYSYNKIVYDTRLNNILLYTGGFGIDILCIYDLNMSLEYSFNQLKEKGLFLHVRSSF